MSDARTNLARVPCDGRAGWPASTPGGRPGRACGWPELDDLVRAEVPLLRAPAVGAAGCCSVCHGPAGRRSRCAQCQLHAECAGGSLADVVVPVAYAVKGDPHARRLWQYKSAAAPVGAAEAAAATLRALALVFLRDHGACVWRAAGMAGPTHVAVVPTARGRPGSHPLRALLAPYLRGRWAELVARQAGDQARDLDPDRFAADPVPGARILLVDDTWTTGASAQSAAMALRLAGALSVATVVLGRHVGPHDAAGAGGPAQMPFRPQSCAVHDAGS